MKITACPRCGSRNIGMGRVEEGTLYGITSWKETCPDCGYQGQPLIFDTEEEYRKFLDALSKKKTKGIEEKTLEEEYNALSEEEKELLDFLKEPEEVEKQRKISVGPANPIMKLSIAIIVVGIVLNIVTFGMYILYLGAIILAGIVMFVFATLPSLASQQLKAKPTIAGILLLIGGILGFINGIILVYFDVTQLDPQIISRLSQDFGRSMYPHGIHAIFVIGGIIFCILSTLAMIGGICAIRRRRWGIAMLGAVVGLFIIGPKFLPTILSIAALILLAFSDFN